MWTRSLRSAPVMSSFLSSLFRGSNRLMSSDPIDTSEDMKRLRARAKAEPAAISNAEWRRLLTKQQYSVTREQGTERAFTGDLWDCHDYGTYSCVCCGTPLFHSSTKFDSGTGWPSFFAGVEENLETEVDDSMFMRRVEVKCRRCKAHLGHVFEDGPRPTGLRFCMNSAALKFTENDDSAKPKQ